MIVKLICYEIKELSIKWGRQDANCTKINHLQDGHIKWLSRGPSNGEGGWKNMFHTRVVVASVCLHIRREEVKILENLFVAAT